MTGDHPEVQLKHHFDAAHRLPHLAGGNSKCANLHGHTWGVTLGISGPVQPDCTVVEFGGIKRTWRTLLDDLFDHGTLLGADDPLLPVFEDYGMKHYVFGNPDDPHAADLPWPSVEAVTVLLVRAASTLILPADCRVTGMTVTETVSNAVTWRAP